MTGEQLKEYKNIYMDIVAPQYVLDAKWSKLLGALPEQRKRPIYYRYVQYSAVFLSLCLVLFVGTFAFAQTAQPGSIFYPLKAATKNISTIFKNTFTPENKIVIPVKKHESIQTQRVVTSVPTPTMKPTPVGKPVVEGISTETYENEHSSNGHNVNNSVSTGIPAQQNTSHGNPGNEGNSNNANNNHGNGDNKGGNSDNSHNNSDKNNSNNNGKK